MLPNRLNVNGKEYFIRTNKDDILKIIEAFNDPELEDKEKVYICLYILYRDFNMIPQKDYEEAFKAAVGFIDCGIKNDNKRPTPSTMDWEQDAPLLYPAINKVAGFETRKVRYMHWWTFMGYYMTIEDGLFSTVLRIRSKKASHKKLEKWEQEFYNSNKDLCVIKKKLSAEEQAAKDRLIAILDGKSP